MKFAEAFRDYFEDVNIKINNKKYWENEFKKDFYLQVITSNSLKFLKICSVNKSNTIFHRLFITIL